MSDTGHFRTAEAEVSKLLEELTTLKDALRDIGGRLSRIENRVSRAFPAVAQRRKEVQEALKSASTPVSAWSPEEAMKAYDMIVETAKKVSYEEADRALKEFTVGDLSLMAKELGVSFRQHKPVRRALVDAILGRVRESVLLSKHTTVREAVERSTH